MQMDLFYHITPPRADGWNRARGWAARERAGSARAWTGRTTLTGTEHIQREDLVEEMASKVITEMDLNGDSLVSSEELFEWCRRNTFNGLVEQFVQERA